MNDVDLYNYNDPFIVVSWLMDNMGYAGIRWEIHELQYVRFERDIDLTWFLMRWSGE